MDTNNFESIKANNNKFAPILVFTVLISVVFVGGFFFGYRLNYINQQIGSSSNNNESSVSVITGNGIYNEVLSKIRNEYISKDLDEKKMTYGSIRGLVESLDDKYTLFLDPEEKKEYSSQNAGEFEGIGTTLRYNGEYTLIESPIDGFPAQKAGLMAADMIIEVNGEDMHKKRANYVASKILGEAGTEVKIKVFREKDGTTYEKNITRALIDMENIEFKMLDNGIAQIKILKFTEASEYDFRLLWDKIITEVVSNNPKGIILDLRNNPGGYVDSAVYVLEEFLPSKTEIFSEVNREGEEVQKFTAREGKLLNIPVVVLVNTGSASASEIVTGALQDHKRAQVVGEPTVGKGVEQKVINLSDGSQINLIFKKWLTPNGHFIKPDDSIKPDQIVELTTENFEAGIDPQIEKAKELLK